MKKRIFAAVAVLGLLCGALYLAHVQNTSSGPIKHFTAFFAVEREKLANTLQVCLDSGAKKVLLPATSFVHMAAVPPELMSSFQIISYSSAEDAVFKALGVE